MLAGTQAPRRPGNQTATTEASPGPPCPHHGLPAPPRTFHPESLMLPVARKGSLLQLIVKEKMVAPEARRTPKWKNKTGLKPQGRPGSSSSSVEHPGWAGTHRFTSRRLLHTLGRPGPLMKQRRDKQGHTHHSQHGTWTEWPTEGFSQSFRITSQPQNPRWPEHLRQHRARMRACETVRARQPVSRSPAWWDLCKKPATRPPAWTELRPRLPPSCDQQGPGSSRAGLAMA